MNISIVEVHPHDPLGLPLIAALDRELAGNYPEDMEEYAKHNLLAEDTILLLLKVENEPVACGAYRRISADTVEIKRMYVSPDKRGQGLSRKILSALEKHAFVNDYKTAKLETGTRQIAAIHLYESAAYNRIANYGPYIGMPLSICYAKSLTG